MTNLIYNQMKPNGQEIRSQGIAHVFFLDSYLSIRNFKWNIDFPFEFTKFLESYGIKSLSKSAVGFVLNIKWTYLVLWVDS